MALDLTKYGAVTQPTQIGGSTGLDLGKYGAKPIATQPTVGNKPTSLFGNPLETIAGAGQEVRQAITGQGDFAGKSSLERGLAASSAAALAIPSVAADIIPGGKPVLGAISDIYKGAIDFAGSIPVKLADIAQKIGIMTPEQRAQYDANNLDFVKSPTGIALQSTAQVGEYLGNIANVILGADSFAKGTQDVLDNKIPKLQEEIKQQAVTAQDTKQSQLIQNTANEIAAVENRYSKGRNANLYSKDQGFESRQRIAGSGVLKHTVDENGLIRTMQPGGAVDTYSAMTVKPAEGVVRTALEREGSKVNIRNVQSELENQIKSSGLEGADLVNALNGVKREIAGLRLKADNLGYVPTTLLQDAKINTYENINFQTPPDVARARKALGRGYKTLIEDNSNLNIREINTELAKYYEDIKRLKSLDGMRVEGGRLGKYAAQIAGNIVGGAFGSLGGPIGAAIGTVVGGETASLVKGKTMGKTFVNKATPVIPESTVLKKAVKEAKSTRLMLPANTSGFRSVKPSGPVINLPKKSGL